MLQGLIKFANSEEGAVTVDWVVLTAAVVALAGASFTAIQDASGGVGNSVNTTLVSTKVGN